MSSLPAPGAIIRRPGQNALIVGLRGSGKTYLTRRLVQAHPRVFIVDPHREYVNVAVAISSVDELVAYLAQTNGRWRISYFSTQLEAEFDALCEIAWELGPCLFAVEEADRFCGPGKISEPFYRIINYGRHAPGPPAAERPVDYLVISRYPAALHVAPRSQAYELYCFNISEPAHVEYIAEVAGKPFADGLRMLTPMHYRFLDRWDPSKGWADYGPDGGLIAPRSAPS